MCPQVVHRLAQFVIGLAEAEHDARLGEHLRAAPLGMGQHPQRLLVTGARIAHRMGQAPYGLDVLREHFETRVDHGIDIRRHPLEIGHQSLDGGLWHQRLDLPHRGREMCSAPVGQIVAVDRGEHHITEAHELYGARRIARLFRIEPATRVAGVDGAEATGPRADLAHQHQGRRAGVPTFADVWAFRLFTDCGEAVLAHRLAHDLVTGATGERRLEPTRLATRHPDRCGGGRLDAVADRVEALWGAIFQAARRARDRVAGFFVHGE